MHTGQNQLGEEKHLCSQVMVFTVSNLMVIDTKYIERCGQQKKVNHSATERPK